MKDRNHEKLERNKATGKVSTTTRLNLLSLLVLLERGK